MAAPMSVTNYRKMQISKKNVLIIKQNNKLTNSKSPVQHRVKGDLILPKSINSHSWERQQAACDLSSQVPHGSLYTGRGSENSN